MVLSLSHLAPRTYISIIVIIMIIIIVIVIIIVMNFKLNVSRKHNGSEVYGWD